MILTLRQVFDKVKAHLLGQGQKAQPVTGMCRYRTPDGKSCAVGCLLADDHYRTDFEGIGIRSTTAEAGALRTALERSGIDANEENTLQMLGELQDLHDSYDVDEWPRRKFDDIERDFFLGRRFRRTGRADARAE